MDTEPITVVGAKKLQDELNDLINNKRQKVIQAIAEAREHGCLLYTSPSPRDSLSSRMPSSA